MYIKWFIKCEKNTIATNISQSQPLTHGVFPYYKPISLLSAVFVLARKHSSDPGATDASTILQAMSVKRYVELVSGGRNNIRTCMQVRTRETRGRERRRETQRDAERRRETQRDA